MLLLLLAVATSTAAANPGLYCGYSWQQAICRDAPAEFSFSDGCNTVTCDGRGEYITTLMACPEPSTDAEKLQCDNIRKEVQARVDSEFSVTCPLLTVGSVCATAPRGFTYSDGCNSVTCDGLGSGITTLKFCPDAAKPPETAACERRVKKLLERLEPRTCQGINATRVCLAEGVGFRFSDGCNTIECGLDGTWTTTLMMCPPASVDSTICRWATSQARVTGPSGRSAPSGGREFACPALAISRICTAQVVGFRYNDGCNDIHCVSPGNAVSTFRLCPPAGAGEADAAVAYCRRAEEQMERLRNQSTARYQCLTAQDVCKTGAERKSFFDGCNYCFCMGVNRAGCTRRACRPYFSTEEEFKAECKRRKAGIIN